MYPKCVCGCGVVPNPTGELRVLVGRGLAAPLEPPPLNPFSYLGLWRQISALWRLRASRVHHHDKFLAMPLTDTNFGELQ